MNWLQKISQQQLMFYPYGRHPDEISQEIPPVSIDSKTGEKFYKCHKCD